MMDRRDMEWRLNACIEGDARGNKDGRKILW
jgi:hypothetical protein